MGPAADPRVDAYIDALPGWQQAVCREVRALVHAADPEIAETIKRTSSPTSSCEGNVCALLATKDHVNVFLYDGAIVPDPEGIITGGPRQQTARTVAFTRASRSTRRPSPRSCARSSRTTGPAAGGGSRRRARPAEAARGFGHESRSSRARPLSRASSARPAGLGRPPACRPPRPEGPVEHR